jgi:biopolymer transport protein ExbD
MIGSQGRRERKQGEAPVDVQFPVTPMLDMAFQLLAFFILTFQSPTSEARLDLYLPTMPVALPGSPQGQARATPPRRSELDLENDLRIRAEADDLGDLRSLRLGETPLPDLDALADRLRRYAAVLEGRPLRVRLIADDRLRYEEAARIIGTCNAVGVASIRLADPASAEGVRSRP